MCLNDAGIIGGNGAGKSTLFKMIMGQETPDSGQVSPPNLPNRTSEEKVRHSTAQGRSLLLCKVRLPHLSASQRLSQFATEQAVTGSVAHDGG